MKQYKHLGFDYRRGIYLLATARPEFIRSRQEQIRTKTALHWGPFQAWVLAEAGLREAKGVPRFIDDIPPPTSAPEPADPLEGSTAEPGPSVAPPQPTGALPSPASAGPTTPQGTLPNVGSTAAAEAPYAQAACDVFDYFSIRLFRRAEEIARKAAGTVQQAQTPVTELPEKVEDYREIFLPKNVPNMIQQMWRWTNILCNYCIATKTLDDRPFQMYCLFGAISTEEWGEAPTKVLQRTVGLPFLTPRTLFSDQYFRNLKRDETVPVFCNVLYLYAACRAVSNNYRLKKENDRKKKERGRKRDREETKDDLPETFLKSISLAVHKIFQAWTAFATTEFSFDSLDDMMWPFLCFAKNTGEMTLVPRDRRLHPCSHRHKIALVEYPIPDGVIIGVGKKSPEAPFPFGKLEHDVIVRLRQFAQDLFRDIDTVVDMEDLYTTRSGTEFCPALLQYEMSAAAVLPERFKKYSDRRKDMVRRALNSVRVRQGLAEMQHVRSPSPPVDSTPTTAQAHTPLPVVLHNLAEKDRKRLTRTIRAELIGHASIVHASFDKLFDTVSVRCDTRVREGSVQLLLTDPPYNVRRGPNAAHDNFSDYNGLAELAKKYLRPGGHAVIFCSALQFSEWVSAFETLNDKGDATEFRITKVPLVFTVVGDTFQFNPAKKALVHINAVDYAFHCVRSPQLVKGDAFKMVQWRSHGHVHSSFPPNSNVMNNVPRVSHAERVPRTNTPSDSNQRGLKEMLRPEQKSVALCRELVCRYSLPGDKVVDPFGGTFAVAEACLTVHEPRRFYGGDKDKVCALTGIDRCMRAFVRCLVNDGDMQRFSAPEEVLSAARTLTEAMSPSQHSTPHDAAEVLTLPPPVPHMPYTQYIPFFTLRLLASSTGVIDVLLPKYETLSPDRWPPLLYAALMNLDMSSVLAAQCSEHMIRYLGAQGVYQGLTPMRPFQPGHVIGHYFGTLVPVDMMQASRNATFGEGLHRVDRALFHSHAVSVVDVNNKILHGDIHLPHLYVVPAPYCPFYAATIAITDEHMPNAALYTRKNLKFNDLLSYKVLEVRATLKIETGTPIIISGKVNFN